MPKCRRPSSRRARLFNSMLRHSGGSLIWSRAADAVADKEFRLFFLILLLSGSGRKSASPSQRPFSGEGLRSISRWSSKIAAKGRNISTRGAVANVARSLLDSHCRHKAFHIGAVLAVCNRGPRGHIRILQAMVSGIPLVLTLRTRMQDPCAYVVFRAPHVRCTLDCGRLTSSFLF